MSRVVKRSAAIAAETCPPRKHKEAASPLPSWIPPQLRQLVETAPSGPQWLHEIKLDGFRMAARIDHGRVQLLTRTGLDWSNKYPTVIAALETVRAESAHLDGELCGIGKNGLPSFSQTQVASAVQFNDHERHACQLGCEGVVSKTRDAPYAPGNRGPMAQVQMPQPTGIRYGRLD